ncbi:all-beta uncharacterized protein [Bacteroides zoogleoformans]|nr:BACON domain-containing protein [Bacteroides zoogleoformans]TWJ18580.1 all-beta uncharacterized protein [Bacteroides zoogleoformans]
MFNKDLAIIGMIMFMSCGIISCADDEFTTRLEIGEDVLAEGIEAEIDGKITTLNISSNDNWTIDVPKDASHWVYVPVKSGQGDQNVPVNIDANFGSSAGRSTTLTITAGNIVKKVAVTQVPTYNGQTVSNDGEAADYIKIAATKGVGMGLNLGRLTTKNNVINLKALNKLQQLNNAEYSAYFTYNKQAKAGAQGAVIDSVDTKKDSLGVALSFDINYGDFKLNIGGAYHGDESKNHYKTEYRYGATYNIASTSADVPSLIALYNDASASKDPADSEQLLKRSLLTPGFIDAKKTVEEAQTKNNNDDFNNAMEDLVDEYGPVVISGCDLGGSVSLWMKYNRDSIAEIMHVDTAHVNAAVNIGLLQIEGKVEVGYKKEGIKIFESSAFKYNIAGGAKVAQDNVSSALSIKRKKGDNDKVYNDLHDKMDAWIASLDANNPATLSYTRLKIYPIWYFFQGKVRSAVKAWIKKNYKDKMDIIDNSVVDADVSDK